MITYEENRELHLANTAELRQMARRIRGLEARVEALENLILESGPVTWVANGDMLSASAWEQRAAELLLARHLGEEEDG